MVKSSYILILVIVEVSSWARSISNLNSIVVIYCTISESRSILSMILCLSPRMFILLKLSSFLRRVNSLSSSASIRLAGGVAPELPSGVASGFGVGVA